MEFDTMTTTAHPVDRKATEIFRASWLSEEARGLLAEDAVVGDYLLTLSQAGYYSDAIQAMVYAMPNRHAVWWLCQSVWHARAVIHRPNDRSALQAAVHWVVRPGEDTLRAAKVAAIAADFESPARCAANAILWAGFGAEIDQAVVNDKQRMAAQLIGGGLSLVLARATTIDFSARQMLALGFDIVHGVSRWDAVLAWHAAGKTA